MKEYRSCNDTASTSFLFLGFLFFFECMLFSASSQFRREFGSFTKVLVIFFFFIY